VSTKRLPDNVLPIWTPRDSVDTAKQFHLELDNAERGVEDFLPPVVLFTARSRERKARLYDRLAVALLLVLCAALGCIALILATPAKADTDPVVVAYSAHYGGAVCSVLDEFPSENGILGIGKSIIEDGLTGYQAGQVLYLSVSDVCPRHMGLLRAFAASPEMTATVA
jgi:hypothetical protein